LIFVIIGTLADLIYNILPVSISFFVYLLSGLRYVGLYLLFISERKNRILYVSIVIILSLITVLRETIFHEMLLWLTFFIIIVAFISKPSIYKKILFFSIILFFALSVQTVKFFYRKALGTEDSNVKLFSNLVQEKVIESDYVFSPENIDAMILRINQGWIIARIMNWVPNYEPYAKGETIKQAVISSLVPRFLYPEKSIAGGREYFTRFTGKLISKNTSMGLGLLGEAYANYGNTGGIIFMFIIGFFYNFFLFLIFKIAKSHPLLIFFIPLLFIQVVKAETDFSVILNHLVKATMAVFMVFFIFRNFLNTKI
jgi:hypothetical protein